MTMEFRENYELIFEKLREKGKKNSNDFIFIIVIIRKNADDPMIALL